MQTVPTRKATGRWRGEPIVMLGLLLLTWAGLRGVMWENPFALPQFPAEWLVPETSPTAPGFSAGNDAGRRHSGDKRPSGVTPGAADFLPAGPTGVLASVPSVSAANPSASQLFTLDDVGTGGGAFFPRALPAAPFQVEAALPPARPHPDRNAAAAPKRDAWLGDAWSGDAWLFLRPDASNRAAASGVLATYGASQAGAVLRYRIAQGSPLAPTAYLRASSSLADTKQAELALGVSARPLKGLPVTFHAEMRAAEIADGSELRPAVFAVAAPPAARLPARTEARFYAQAGYVAGSFATAFVDGQARIDREVARLGAGANGESAARPLRLRAGFGAWGGAQRGAARADIGPTVAAQFSLGRLPVTAAADYRFRIAGTAQPASGAALTLSTNF